MKDVIMTVLQAVLIAAIPVIVGFICRYLWAKKEALETDEAFGEFSFILAQAMEAVTTAVQYVCQTYVDGLKQSGKFTVENQKKAFQMAYDKACLIMTQEAKDFIKEVYGSLSAWLTAQIEAQVRLRRRTMPKAIMSILRTIRGTKYKRRERSLEFGLCPNFREACSLFFSL